MFLPSCRKKSVWIENIKIKKSERKWLQENNDWRPNSEAKLRVEVCWASNYTSPSGTSGAALEVILENGNTDTSLTCLDILNGRGLLLRLGCVLFWDCTASKKDAGLGFFPELV